MGSDSRTETSQIAAFAGSLEPDPEETLRLLETLRAAERRIHSAPSPQEASEAALTCLPLLLRDYLGGCLLTISPADKTFQIQASDRSHQLPAWEAWGRLILEDPTLSEKLLADDGWLLPLSSKLLGPVLAELPPCEGQVCLCLPLQDDRALIGLLFVACGSSAGPGEITRRSLQLLANSLAAALSQNSLRKSERQRRVEAEAMRDIMAALAGAGNLNQTLQIVLVSLRNVIEYDRAGLYLLDENQRYVLAEKSRPGQDRSIRINQSDDPLVAELQETRAPILVEDIQVDPRFEAWPDMQSIHGWLGCPLFVGDEMLGFLSLGSLEPGGFGETDAAMLQAFTRQIAQVLDNAWLQEQSSHRTEELELLSTLTFALGEAESRESTLSAIVAQIRDFLHAEQGSFLAETDHKDGLVVKFSPDETLPGRVHPPGEDLLWEVFESGEVYVLREVPAFLSRNPQEIYQALFQDTQSAILVPLRSFETTFGLLCFTFKQRRSFSSKEINLITATAEIATTSLRRALVLEALEKKVSLRTQQLSTLYNLNAIANEPFPLETILERLLAITLESMGCQIGAIHILDQAGDSLHLAAQQNLTPEVLPHYEYLQVRKGFWKELVSTSNPLILADLRLEERLPVELRSHPIPEHYAFLGTPIRAKGQPLGLLSLFTQSIRDYSLEDITLFMTIADQIGISVERARLTRQSELAAVVEERQRLARELHDSVTQLLYGQVLFSGASLKSLELGKIDLLEQHLQRLDQAALQALKEMRLLVYELRPADYLEQGLAAALQNRLDAVEKRTGMNASLSIDGELNLDETTEIAFYRIAQEALNNTLKHSGAKSVSIQLRTGPDRISLEISDDGCGFELEEGSLAGGMGLTSMLERAAEIGADLEISTTSGCGTLITVTLQEAA